MQKSILKLATAAASCLLAPAAFAQSPYYGYPTNASPWYQPMPTSMMFQDADGGVPIPGDATTPPGTSTPTQDSSQPVSSAPLSTDSMFIPAAPSMPIYQDGTTWNAFSPVFPQDQPLTQPQYSDPAMTPYAPYSPYGNSYGNPYGYEGGIPPQGAYSYGATGANPYRFGWQNRIDVSWLPSGDVSGGPAGTTGDMEIFGVDYDLAYGTPFIPGTVLNWTNQFSYRNWNGPDGTLGLPSDLFRFGIDLEWETPKNGPFSISLGVTPSINTDFDGDTWGDGFQLDGRGILFWQLDQYWTLGLGAMFWDRVDDQVIPYAGLIYRDDYWEWQLMYPEAKVSVFLGNEPYWSKWAYVRAEFHSEAYAVNRSLAGVSVDDEIQIEDYRVLLGFKMDSGLYSWFIEGGWVFDRQVEFDSNIPGYDLDTGFIGQIGLRY